MPGAGAVHHINSDPTPLLSLCGAQFCATLIWELAVCMIGDAVTAADYVR